MVGFQFLSLSITLIALVMSGLYLLTQSKTIALIAAIFCLLAAICFLISVALGETVGLGWIGVISWAGCSIIFFTRLRK